MQAILTLKTPEELMAFFEDICTIKELQDLAQRLEVASLLYDKKVFREIAESTGASSATISRVNKCIMYGTGGYKTAIEDLENNTGHSYSQIYIVGGGAKNTYLNSLTESYTYKRVIALPIEATAIGNLRTQLKRIEEI